MLLQTAGFCLVSGSLEFRMNVFRSPTAVAFSLCWRPVVTGHVFLCSHLQIAVKSPWGGSREPWNMYRWIVQLSLSILGWVWISSWLEILLIVLLSVTLCGSKHFGLSFILVNWSTKEAESLRLKSGLVASNRKLRNIKPTWALEKIQGQPRLLSLKKLKH